MKRVWIVYRTYSIGQHQRASKVEAVVAKKKRAKKAAKKLCEDIDPIFGVYMQEWILEE